VLRGLPDTDIEDAVAVPIGFVCDHVEVLYDLDVEARAVAAEIGVRFHRAQTANDHPAFIAMLADLVERGAA
jgi:ferrochelatase